MSTNALEWRTAPFQEDVDHGDLCVFCQYMYMICPLSTLGLFALTINFIVLCLCVSVFFMMESPMGLAVHVLSICFDKFITSMIQIFWL